jgi:hypothetical protein
MPVKLQLIRGNVVTEGAELANGKKPRRGNGPPPDLPPAGGEEKYRLAIIFNLFIFQLSYFLLPTSYSLSTRNFIPQSFYYLVNSSTC